MKTAIKRSSLLPLLGMEVECTGLLAYIVRKDRCNCMLVLNVKIGDLEFDHVWIALKK